MSMIKDMKTYLISRGVSEPIFLGSISDAENECIGLYRYAGQPPLTEADIERMGLQVRCRSANYEDAVLEMHMVANFLCQIGDDAADGDAISIDGTKYVRVTAVQSAVCTQCDEYSEMVQNFVVSVIG